MTGGLASPPDSRNNSPMVTAGSSSTLNSPNFPTPKFVNGPDHQYSMDSVDLADVTHAEDLEMVVDPLIDPTLDKNGEEEVNPPDVQKDAVDSEDVQMVDAGMKNSSSGEADEDANGEEEVNPPDVQKDAVDSEDVQMVDAGMKNSSSGEANKDANGKEEVNPQDVQKDAVDSEEGSSEDERDLDPDSAEKGSLSDSSEDEQVDPPKESSYDSLGEEQVDNAVDVQSKKTLLDSDL